MLKVGYVEANSRYRYNSLNFRGNIFEKNPIGKITDMHIGEFNENINSYTVAHDILHDIISLFTLNKKGELSGNIKADKGTSLYDSISRLAKKGAMNNQT